MIDAKSHPLIRKAETADLDAIRRILNSKNNRASFGWVMRVVLEDAIVCQDRDPGGQHLFLVAEHGGECIGFARAYHRRDGVTTLHELGIREDCQRQGVGTSLLDSVIQIARSCGRERVRLKTPTEAKSNAYYPRFGFGKTGTEKGRIRELNVYELALI